MLPITFAINSLVPLPVLLFQVSEYQQYQDAVAEDEGEDFDRDYGDYSDYDRE